VNDTAQKNLWKSAYRSARKSKDTYANEALMWRTFYEELRPFLVSTPTSDAWKEQADKMLSEVRSG
jgi:hypothetical protein